VSKRNEFTCAEELVEDALPHIPPGIPPRSWLLTYTESVIRRLAHEFSVGAERGVLQTAELLCDPDFYETRKRRRTNQMKSWKQQQQMQEAEQRERLTCPTAEQLTQQIKNTKEQIDWHDKQLQGYRQQLERLEKMKTKNIRLVPRKPN